MVIICVFSAAVSNFGLDQIVSIASPILNVVYPPTLVLIVLAFFDKYIQNDWLFRLTALGAMVTSILGVISDFGVEIPFLQYLPFSSLGFGWVLPAVICGLAGMLIGNSRKITEANRLPKV